MKKLFLLLLLAIAARADVMDRLVVRQSGSVTNITAVGLTGSLTNISLFGDTIIDTGDELQDTVDYSLALTPNGNTPTENDASARPRSVATISSLVGDVDPLLVPTYARVSVLGYHSAGDGGGGDFRRVLASSGTTNAGTFFASTANALYAWERVVDGPITPEMFGAVGDGVTDDTTACNAAVAYAASNGLPLVARGQYRLGTSSLLLLSNTVIDGQGTGQFLRGFAGNGTYTNTFGTLQNHPLALLGSYTNAAEVPANTTNIVLRNLSIGNLDASTYTNGRSLCLWGVRGVRLENCFIGPISQGWAVDIWGDDGVVNNCVVTNVADVFSDGFHLIGGRRWTISNSQFTGGDDALALLQVYDHSMSDVTVANNYLRSYKAHAIRIGRWNNVPPASQTNLMERINVIGNVCEAGWRNGGIFVEDQLVSGTNYTKLLKDITIADTKILLRSDYATGGVTNGYGARVVGGKDILLSAVTITNAYQNSLFNHVDGLTLDKVSIRNNSLFNASFEGSTSVTLLDCDFASDRASSTVAMYGNGATVIRGGTFNNSGAVNALLIQGTGSDNVSLAQTRFTGNGVGVNLNPLPAVFSAVQCDFASTLTPISYSGAGASGTKPAVTDLFGNVNVPDFFRNASVTYVVPITKSVGSSATMETWTRTDTATSATLSMQGGFLSWHTAGNWFQFASAIGLYGRSSTANTTQKKFGYHIQHYNTAEEPLAGLWGDSAASTSDIYIGGGSSLLNAATTVHIYAAANTTTTTGTEVVRVTSSGVNVVAGTLTTAGAIELNHASANTLTATNGVLYLESTPLIDSAVGTLTYSGTDITITAGKGALQEDTLTCTNNATLAWTGLAAKDAGTIYVTPAATNCTFTLPSYAFGPSGSTLTIAGGTGNTNYTIIAWLNTVIGGTNRVSVNALNYYR